MSALSMPLLGIALGLSSGLVLFLLSRASFKRMTPEDPARGYLVVSISLFARLAVATFILWAYKAIAPTGFVPFALSLAGGFLVLFTYEAVRYSRLLGKVSRPAGGHR